VVGVAQVAQSPKENITGTFVCYMYVNFYMFVTT